MEQQGSASGLWLETKTAQSQISRVADQDKPVSKTLKFFRRIASIVLPEGEEFHQDLLFSSVAPARIDRAGLEILEDVAGHSCSDGLEEGGGARFGHGQDAHLQTFFLPDLHSQNVFNAKGAIQGDLPQLVEY